MLYYVNTAGIEIDRNSFERLRLRERVFRLNLARHMLLLLLLLLLRFHLPLLMLVKSSALCVWLIDCLIDWFNNRSSTMHSISTVLYYIIFLSFIEMIDRSRSSSSFNMYSSSSSSSLRFFLIEYWV